MNAKQRKMIVRIISTIILLIVYHIIKIEEPLKLIGYLVAYLIIGYDILQKALKGIKNRRVFDENFLMAIATVGAFALAIYSRSGDYLEAISVMLFYQIGELFQSIAIGKSRKNISDLMDIRPDYANIEIDGVLEQVDPDDVEIGSIIIVNPGEKVPIDGIVIEGMSSLDTSALTGESLPREIKSGDEIISGCINLSGVLRIETTKEFGESTVSAILDMVENASSRKSRSEEFISKFARYYTPAVCYGALALAILPPLVRFFVLNLSPNISDWIYRALTFLVISCPCALVVSIPLSFFAGIGGASHAGILIKGSNYMETLSQTKYVAFDKTGTLTNGSFSVSHIHHNNMDEAKLLEYAALAESASHHPIAQSIVDSYQAITNQPLNRNRVSNIEEISGNGVKALVDSIPVAIGNDKLMNSLNIEYAPCHKSGTILHIAINGVYEGHIVVSDTIKENSSRAIAALKAAGIKSTIMLTGDAESVAKEVAATLAIDEYHSQLLPADKVSIVEQLLLRKGEKEKFAFVGDGINDAPVLSRSDIGIAMGAMGSDAAIEAADIVLMDDDPLKIAKAINISKKCIGIVYQNITFALLIKFSCLALGALGIANMWYAIFADVGVMILAVLNAIRALNVKKL